MSLRTLSPVHVLESITGKVLKREDLCEVELIGRSGDDRAVLVTTLRQYLDAA